MVAKEETEEEVVLSTCPTTNCHLTGVLPLASNSQEGADAMTRNPRHCPSTGEDLFLPSHGPEFEKHRSFSDSIQILAVRYEHLSSAAELPLFLSPLLALCKMFPKFNFPST